jgi:uncharacterized protein YndB with AHSA1/START domain
MAAYEFLTTWCLRDAPAERAFEVLRDSASYPQWWAGVERAEVLQRGDADGIGEVTRLHWRSVLPYTLSFEMRITRMESPYLIEGHATGELEGVGTWRLYEGRGLAVVYDWRVHTTKPWMNVLGPIARPAFVWNHDLVMRNGARGFADVLSASLVVTD